ncbi:uncharacterized protein [Physcomitrium patens]|uniref:Uncharacterized protein n=1 Tax=Physcomitrium patens TaxID=3218 RepID=A0A2K1KIM4_PHYPA|nr:hypothetical protein PHYPA_007290 [Physcomitrium patens]
MQVLRSGSSKVWTPWLDFYEALRGSNSERVLLRCIVSYSGGLVLCRSLLVLFVACGGVAAADSYCLVLLLSSSMLPVAWMQRGDRKLLLLRWSGVAAPCFLT